MTSQVCAQRNATGVCKANAYRLARQSNSQRDQARQFGMGGKGQNLACGKCRLWCDNIP